MDDLSPKECFVLATLCPRSVLSQERCIPGQNILGRCVQLGFIRGDIREEFVDPGSKLNPGFLR
jgi:hypothetical protein